MLAPRVVASHGGDTDRLRVRPNQKAQAHRRRKEAAAWPACRAPWTPRPGPLAQEPRRRSRRRRRPARRRGPVGTRKPVRYHTDGRSQPGRDSSACSPSGPGPMRSRWRAWARAERTSSDVARDCSGIDSSDRRDPREGHWSFVGSRTSCRLARGIIALRREVGPACGVVGLAAPRAAILATGSNVYITYCNMQCTFRDSVRGIWVPVITRRAVASIAASGSARLLTTTVLTVGRLRTWRGRLGRAGEWREWLGNNQHGSFRSRGRGSRLAADPSGEAGRPRHGLWMGLKRATAHDD